MKELINSISKKEWQFVALLAIIIIVITGLPYLYAYLTAPTGFVYNGLDSLTPADNPVYYSYINQVKRGEFFLKNLFTPEEQTTGLFNVFWFSIGIFARIFKLSAIFSFHLIRLLLIPIFLVVAYLFICLFFKEAVKRKLSLFLLSFSSGVGAYFVIPLYLYNLEDKPGFWSPNDTWIPESITFLTFLKTPHFIASLIFMFLIFLLMFLAFSKKRFSYSLAAGFLGLIYFNFHPFYIPTIFSTLGLYLLIMIFKERRILWREIGYYLLFIAITSPSIFYHIWTLNQSEVLLQRAFQNITLSPPFIFIIIGYGFLWLLAVIGVYRLVIKKQLNNQYIFLLALIATCILFIKLPSPFQSRYTQGLHPALVIFTVTGLFYLKDKILTKRNIQKYNLLLDNQVLLIILFVTLLSISNIFILTRDFYYFTKQPGRTLEYLYIPQNSLVGMQQLAQISSPQIILANTQNSLFIPVFSPHQVYAAHNIESLNYKSKLPYLQWFFTNDRYSKEKFEFLKRNNIDYIFISDQEKKPGYFNPDFKDYLKLVYQNPGAWIYQVVK